MGQEVPDRVSAARRGGGVQDGGATAALEAERDGLQADLRIASEALRETVDRLELYQVQRQQMEAALRRFDARLGQRDRCARSPAPPRHAPMRRHACVRCQGDPHCISALSSGRTHACGSCILHDHHGQLTPDIGAR